MNDQNNILNEEDSHMGEPIPPTEKSKTINKLVYLALAIIAAGIGIFAYWALQPSDPLEITNSPFPVRTIRQEPTPDGVLILTVDYCKHQDIPGKVRTSFVSQSREVFLPVVEEHLPTGCYKNREVAVVIPRDLVPDTYKIQYRIIYNINPLKSEVVKEFETQSFTVSDSGDPGTAIIAPQPKPIR